LQKVPESKRAYNIVTHLDYLNREGSLKSYGTGEYSRRNIPGALWGRAGGIFFNQGRDLRNDLEKAKFEPGFVLAELQERDKNGRIKIQTPWQVSAKFKEIRKRYL